MVAGRLEVGKVFSGVVAVNRGGGGQRRHGVAAVIDPVDAVVAQTVREYAGGTAHAIGFIDGGNEYCFVQLLGGDAGDLTPEGSGAGGGEGPAGILGGSGRWRRYSHPASSSRRSDLHPFRRRG